MIIESVFYPSNGFLKSLIIVLLIVIYAHNFLINVSCNKHIYLQFPDPLDNSEKGGATNINFRDKIYLELIHHS